MSLWQTCSEKRLLDHDNDRSACICGVAASNQHDLHLDPVPLEPSLGPNRAVVRWLIWALERSAAHERVPSGRATMPLMHPMMSVDPIEGARRAQCPPGLHFSASAQRRTGLYPDARHSNVCVFKKVRFVRLVGVHARSFFIRARGFRGETPRSIIIVSGCAGFCGFHSSLGRYR